MRYMGYLQKAIHSVPFVLFGVALLVVHEEMKTHAFADFAQAWHGVPLFAILVAAGLTAANYLILALYDWLGLHFAGHKQVPWRQVLFTSFISYGISNTTGHSWASGGSLRYRYYSALGVPGWDVAKLTFFLTLTFIVGLMTLGLGVGLLVPSLPQGALSNPHLLSLATVACAGGLALYWSATFMWRKPIRFKTLEINLPTPAMAATQMLVACLDLLLASLVLWVFVKDVPGMDFPVFIVLYVMALVLGFLSQVPGGIGVFEGAFLWLAGPVFATQHPQIVAGLVFYRVIYYFLPLAASGVLLVGKDLPRAPHRMARVGKAAAQKMPSTVPQIFSVLLFLTGGVLLVSGATPALPQNISWLRGAVPLPVMEISHFTGSLVGVLLLFLARAVRLKLDAAWYGALILLALGMAASLLKGLDWQEASILGSMLVAIALSRRHFYRKSSLIGLTFTPVWTFMIVIMLALTAWLGFFSFKHVEYANDLWWQFSYRNDASRFLRSLLILCVAACVLLIRQWLAPQRPITARATPEDLERAWPLVTGSTDTQAFLAMLGDKSFFWSENGKAFLTYAATPSHWIAMGDPVGDKQTFDSLLWRFREEADRYGAKIVFYQVGDDHLPLYLDLGLSLLKLGEEARVTLAKFSLEGSKRDGLRGNRNKMMKHGYVFKILEREETVAAMDRLAEISNLWMARKNVREKGFSLGFFNDVSLRRSRTAVINDSDGRIVAFANMLETETELSVDLMRYDPEALRGVMDFLFAELLLWGKGQGITWFNLGMAPLAGLERHPLAPLWHKIGTVIFDLGEEFYNFEGLHDYKAKFDPEWRPRYLATPAGISAPFILLSIARLISRGFKGIVTK